MNSSLVDPAISLPIARSPRLRTVALPVEHGGWGLLLEPIALGMAIAPSWAGLFIAIAATSAFLARHPLRLVIADRRRGRRFARTVAAERFALLYLVTASASLLGAWWSAGSWASFVPLLIAVPFAVVQLVHDASGQGRALLPELAGAVAMAATAPAIALISGTPVAVAFALGAVLVARAVPAILYVRARLAVLHRQPADPTMALLAQVIAGLAVAAMVTTGMLPLLALVAFLVLFIRAAYGLSGYDPAATAKVIGFREVGFGVVTVTAVIAGYYFSL